MAGPRPKAEVRLGVPHDMTGPFLPQALRAFGRERPGVRIVLQASTSGLIRQALARDELDLGLSHEHGCDAGGEVLFTDPLLWVGASGGGAWRRDPLPLLVGGPSCAFRAPVLEALARQGRDWEQPCECDDLLREIAALEADVAVGVFLRSTLPAGLAPVPAEAGLPALPTFNVDLYVRRGKVAPAVEELALHIKRRLLPLAAVGLDPARRSARHGRPVPGPPISVANDQHHERSFANFPRNIVRTNPVRDSGRRSSRSRHGSVHARLSATPSTSTVHACAERRRITCGVLP